MPAFTVAKGGLWHCGNHQVAVMMTLALWHGTSIRTLGTGNGFVAFLRCVVCTFKGRSIENISTFSALRGSPRRHGGDGSGFREP